MVDFYSRVKEKDKLQFLNNPPRIPPNYGKKAKKNKSPFPKSNVPKVLLYENSMQTNMLGVKTKYIQRQRKRVERMFIKSEYIVKDQLKINMRAHEQWNAKYEVLKKDFIQKYGLRAMPDFDEELEDEICEEGILAHARIAPPINILCFYILAGMDKRAQAKRREKERILKNMEKIKERDRLMDELYKKSNFHAIDDRRFKCLTGSLVALQIETDGYRQLSPTYEKIPVSQRWKPGTAKHYRHGLVLPEFYLKQRRASSATEYDNEEEDGEEAWTGKYDNVLPRI